MLASWWSVMFGVAMSANAVYVVVLHGPVESVRQAEWIIATCVLGPLPFAVVPLVYSPRKGDPFWCFVSKAYGHFQIILLYGWVWAALAVMAASLALVRRELRRSEETFVIEGKMTHATKTRKLVIKRLVVFMTAFLVVWTPASVNRPTQIITHDSVFALSVLHAAFLTMNGMINFAALLTAV
ncbi:hypothetical protein HK105_208932 [Polyrhizophydium stewartii]|uniref:G-protein coupled receptors family 2 profile 2 domain-containing protein n=1 Tax=Polyrhizophydium stewartii TaxID=2732419 RepID=A0ABR4MWD8_9FUNG|nr:hypothetical protein HK105_004114 [Polyrhizophydium stewartii]